MLLLHMKEKEEEGAPLQTCTEGKRKVLLLHRMSKEVPGKGTGEEEQGEARKKKKCLGFRLKPFWF